MNTISTVIRRLVGGHESTGAGPIQATWNDAVVASSERTVVVEGNHYFPPDSVDRAHLEPSEKTTVCPWKGRAGYYDIVVGQHRNAAAAWYYPDPSKAAEKIRDHVAFGHGVRIDRAAQS